MPKFRNAIALDTYSSLLASNQLSPPHLPGAGAGLKELMLSVARACNLACSYCFADQGSYGSSQKGLMDFPTARKAIDEALDEHGFVASVKFFGGEPLLNFSLIEEVVAYFRALKDHGKIPQTPIFTLVTNLTRLTEQMVDCFRQNQFLVTVSLDGPAEIHDAFRVFHDGSGSFLAVDANLRRLTSAIGERTRIEAVYGPQHCQAGLTIAALFEYFASEYNVSNIIIHPVVDNDYFSSSRVSLMRPGLKRYTSEMYDLSVEFGRALVRSVVIGRQVMEVGMFLRDLAADLHTDSHCSLGIDRLNVEQDGTISPCYTLTGRSEFVMRSVSENEADDSAKRRAVQGHLLKNRKSSNPTCAECDILTTCKSCPGIMVQQSGQLNSPINVLCDHYVGKSEGMLTEMSSLDGEAWDGFLRSVREICSTLDDFN